jgi:hypothetical protein
MRYFLTTFYLFLFLAPVHLLWAQTTADSTHAISRFSGNIGITNNGFSIIPTFSLNSPAVIMNYYVRKKRFSFDPDIRLVPDGSKGGLLFWFRYYAIEQKKFSLRLGAHPAFSLIRRTVTENAVDTEITEVLRFAAGEIVPNYQITKNWGVSAVYLHGSGLQQHGPQRTNVLFLNTSIANIKVAKQLRFQLIPTVFFLNVDGNTGDYLSVTGILSHQKWPFLLQSTVNQTFRSNIPGNQNFMWNVTLNYRFSRNYTRVR